MRIGAAQYRYSRSNSSVFPMFDGSTVHLRAFGIGHHSGDGTTWRCAVMNGPGLYRMGLGWSFGPVSCPGLWHM